MSGVRNDLLQLIADRLIDVGRGTNSKNINATYRNPAGPHALTIRVSYIVPANRRAVVRGLNATFICSAVGAAPAGITGDWEMTQGVNPTQGIMRNIFRYSALEDKISNSITCLYHLQAGDSITYSTNDASTGGAVYYTANATIEEYDT